ncbi:MAG: NADH-quinone oxidoreductase subunit N [Acidimicrobiia bacterium]
MSPRIDWHAFAPQIILVATIVVVLVADLLFEDRDRWQTPRIASVGVLAAFIPVLTLAASGELPRSMFGGAYVVDQYSLAFTGFFLGATYLTLLLSVDYLADGDYKQGEFWLLLLTAVLGMTVMPSSRDLVTIFVALETVSIPTYVLAGWRKHDTKSNEASIKYYLIGVLSSAVMLYGMSFIYGISGSTLLSDIGRYSTSGSVPALYVVAVFFTLVGFAFKVSAVPFHTWAPDTYEGSPTPVTAFLSVASKAVGFVAILNLVYLGFYGSEGSWQPVLWVLAALSMTVGNLAALRQTNVVRMLAYSSVAQGGFILVPLAVAGDSASAAIAALQAVIVYLIIYGAMNLGAFAVVITAARRTHSAEIRSFDGMGQWAPGLALAMTLFLFSLAGIPPLGGWFAKFLMFRAVFDAGTPAAVALGVIAAVNTVIAFFYYARVARRMWFHAPSAAMAGEAGRAIVPPALVASIAITLVVVLAVGVYPQLVARVGELARFATG